MSTISNSIHYFFVTFVVALGLSGCGADTSSTNPPAGQDALADECVAMADHLAPCCGLSSNEVNIVTSSCQAQVHSWNSAQLTTLACLQQTSCIQWEAGACGSGFGCQNALTELCKAGVDHNAACCGSTADQITAAKSQCEVTIFSEAERPTFECVLANTCAAQVNGACGGLMCN